MSKAIRISMLLVFVFNSLSVPQTAHAQGMCVWYYEDTLLPPAPYNLILDVGLQNAVYTPRRVRGDADFSGNGPHILAHGIVTLDSEGMWVDAFMSATETKSDWTTASGWGYRIPFFRVRPGYKIRGAGRSTWEWRDIGGGASMAYQTVDKDSIVPVGSGLATGFYEYTDKDHEPESFPVPDADNNPKNNLISRVEIVGDTKGPEAGSKTSTTFVLNVTALEICH